MILKKNPLGQQKKIGWPTKKLAVFFFLQFPIISKKKIIKSEFGQRKKLAVFFPDSRLQNQLGRLLMRICKINIL